MSSDSANESIRRLAHDLRNVLVSLQSVAAAIERVLEPRDVALAGQLAVIVEHATSLALELAHAESEELPPRDARCCSMGTTLLRSRAILERIAAPVPLELFAEAEDGEIGLSEEALERIAINLVRNARRASGSVGAIRVVVRRSQGDGDGPWDTLMVDNADAESRSEGPWARVPDGEIQPGLGLTIVRELVESAHGRLHFLRSSAAVVRAVCALPVRPVA